MTRTWGDALAVAITEELAGAVVVSRDVYQAILKEMAGRNPPFDANTSSPTGFMGSLLSTKLYLSANLPPNSMYVIKQSDSWGLANPVALAEARIPKVKPPPDPFAEITTVAEQEPGFFAAYDSEGNFLLTLDAEGLETLGISVRPVKTPDGKVTRIGFRRGKKDLRKEAKSTTFSTAYGGPVQTGTPLMETGPSFTAPVRMVATHHVSLQDPVPPSLDGVGLHAGDRVLLTAQNDTRQNGIYKVDSIVKFPTSVGGFGHRWVQEDAPLAIGSIVMISEGTHNGDTCWVLSDSNRWFSLAASSAPRF